MKKALFLLTAIIVTACAEKPAIKSGDLLFVGLPMDFSLDTTSMSSGIVAATSDGSDINYVHTAILESANDTIWIIDATIKRGVARYPLQDFLKDFTLRDGSYPLFEVYRFKNGPKDLVENAKKAIGEPYDVYFLPDNGARYCTELVRDSYLDENGSPILPAAPMNFKGPDGEFPVYWQQLFASINSTIPQDTLGTNPQDMIKSPLLRKVDIDVTNL